MARWMVREIAEQKGFKSAYQLALEAKLPINTVKPIWEGTSKGAMLRTIEKLAVALEVRPGELIGNDGPPLHHIDEEVWLDLRLILA